MGAMLRACYAGSQTLALIVSGLLNIFKYYRCALEMNNAMSLSSLELEDVEKLLAVIGDEDTCVGFMLAGIGEVDENRETNFMVVDRRTTPAQIEACFKKFLARPDIGIILINQVHADLIRPTVDAHLLAVPTVIEIPSKQHPYEVLKDSILKRVRGFMSPPKRRR